jgi:FkbM family methyltransferase
MSDLNLQWLEENFSHKPVAFFNIGCADITDDTFRFTVALPKATVYSFECSNNWKQSNIDKSKVFGFHYCHKAVSYYDGQGIFYSGAPSIDFFWQYRGRLIDPQVQKDQRPWQQETVDVITLNTFCTDHNIKPDFLHIDTEGEEYNILKNLDEKFYPDAIWLEYWKRYHDDVNKRVDFQTLHQLLIDRNYKKIYQKSDVLYVKNDCNLSTYTEYQHYMPDNIVPISDHEKIIQQRIWIKRYNVIKDSSWPNIDNPREFFDLPMHVQDECREIFNLAPQSDILV